MTTTNNSLTVAQILEQIRDRGGRRIKLGITDIDGVLRGKYLSLDKFASIASSSAGFCDCIFGWDIDDQLYDNTSFSTWDKGFPDTSYRLVLDSVRWLPDEPTTPFFLAELVPPDGQEFHPICPRNVLRRVLARLDELDLAVRCGFEYEFFVFAETPDSLREKGFRDLDPFTPGNFGYSVLQTSVHAELHQQFLDYCADLDTPLEGYHTETGPGVMEAALTVAPALEAADRATLFKTFSKVFFLRRNLVPTFMAKWHPKYPGQGGHLHVSLVKASTGEPVFYDGGAQASMSAAMRQFVAGQVMYMRELCALPAPTVNSYSRLVEGAWAPTAATWGIDNRTTSLRVIGGSANSQRVEFRLAGSDANPYLAAAAALASGVEGIEQTLELGSPTRGNAYAIQRDLPVERQLPKTLRTAAGALERSELARRWFGDDFVDHFVATRLWESRQYEQAITDFELKRYFELA